MHRYLNAPYSYQRAKQTCSISTVNAMGPYQSTQVHISPNMCREVHWQWVNCQWFHMGHHPQDGENVHCKNNALYSHFTLQLGFCNCSELEWQRKVYYFRLSKITNSYEGSRDCGLEGCRGENWGVGGVRYNRQRIWGEGTLLWVFNPGAKWRGVNLAIFWVQNIFFVYFEWQIVDPSPGSYLLVGWPPWQHSKDSPTSTPPGWHGHGYSFGSLHWSPAPSWCLDPN